jgi:hypothetical protein
VNRSRRVLAFLSLLVLAGCSSTTFFYNRLDFLIPWYVDRYVELDREQDRYLEQQLVPLLAWHRAEELPRYRELLEQALRLLDDTVTPLELEELSLAAEQAWLRLEYRGLDGLIELGGRLSDEQMADFIAELRQRQEKYEGKYLSRSEQEYRDDASENLRDSLQDYLGRLNDDQKARLEEAAAQLIRSDAIWLSERALWIDRLEGILRREPGWEQRLRAAIREREETVSDAYAETYDHNRAVVYQAIADTLNSRTGKQDRRLRRELADLSADLQTLIEQGRQASAGA